MTGSSHNPVLVEVTRGPAVESFHRGRACIVTSDGQLIEAWGDVTVPIYPRSCVKPLQALAFLETGAAHGIGADDGQIALACASHSAEPEHMARLTPWLETLGLPAEALACGPHLPNDESTATAMIRRGEAPGRLHNNCSGKHLAMLSTALHMAETPDGYATASHPVQQRVRARLSDFGGVGLDDQAVGIDGCGIPTVAMPLTALARGFARLGADPGAESQRIRAAMAAHPVLVGGNERFDSKILAAVGDRAIIKCGAEAVHAAAIPSLGLGVALKIDDGARRAAEVAMAALLRYLKVIDDTGSGRRCRKLSNRRSTTRPAPRWAIFALPPAG